MKRRIRQLMERWWRVTTLSASAAYARWAADYPPYAHNPLMQAEERALLALMPPVQDGDVLDLATGTGRYGRLVLARGARTVYAVDNSAAMLRANALALRVEASSEALPLPSACVDLVVCALALGHVPALDATFREMRRVLRAGGVILVSDFHPLLALTGRQRTFSTGGQMYAVEHTAHLYSDYHRAARMAGLRITDVLEPRLSLNGQNLPVVIVYRFEVSSAG